MHSGFTLLFFFSNNLFLSPGFNAHSPKNHIVGITGEMNQAESDAVQTGIPVTITYAFINCFVRISGDGRYTETVFHDGTIVRALPDETEEYRAKARLYGYDEDCAALSREHEFLHSFLAERLRGGASHALWAVAHGQQSGQVSPTWEQEQEEAQVLAFQQFLNGSDPTQELADLFGGRENLELLKNQALSLLRNYPFGGSTKQYNV